MNNSITDTPAKAKKSLGLGDRVKQALEKVGITEERVSGWLGIPCNCKERQEKLNQLGRWASRILSGRVDKAEEYLVDITKESSESGRSVSSDG